MIQVSSDLRKPPADRTPRGWPDRLPSMPLGNVKLPSGQADTVLSIAAALKERGVDVATGPAFIFKRMSADQWPDVLPLLARLTPEDASFLSRLPEPVEA